MRQRLVRHKRAEVREVLLMWELLADVGSGSGPMYCGG